MTHSRAFPFSTLTAIEAVLVVACALFFFAAVLVQVDSYDLWFHLALGRKILATGHVPTVDSLTLLGAGRPYLDSHWLFQIAAYGVARVAGVGAIPLLQAVIYGAVVVLWLHHRTQVARGTGARLLVTLLVVVGIAALSRRFLPRPEAITYLGVTALICLFERYRRTASPWLFAAPLVMVVWQNCHALYVLGYFIAAAYLAEAVIRRGRAPGEAAPAILPLWATTAMCVAVYPLNPHGGALLGYSLLLATEVGDQAHPLMRSLGELTSTFAADNVRTLGFAAYCLLVAAAAGGLVATRHRPSWARIAILATFFLLSLTGNRNTALFAAAATPLVIAMASELPWRLAPRALATVALVVVVALSVQTVRLVTNRHYRDLGMLKRFGTGVLHEVYPEAEVAFLRALAPPPGEPDPGDVPIALGHFDPFGGYYAYSLPDRYRPLFDGRWEVVDQDHLWALYQALGDPPRYLALLAPYAIHLYAVDHRRAFNLPLLRYLYHDPAWALVFAGPRAALFAERVAANRALIADHPVDLGAAAATVAVTPERVARQEPQAWMNLMLNLGEETAAMEVARRILAVVPAERQTAELLAGRLVARGALPEALAVIDRATQAGVASPPLAAEEAYLHMQRGDLPAALAAMERAVRLDPDNGELHTNFALLYLAAGDLGGAAHEIDAVARLAPDNPALPALRARLTPHRAP